MEQRSFKEFIEALKSGTLPGVIPGQDIAFASGEIIYEDGKVVKKILHHSENLEYEEAQKIQEMAEKLSPPIPPPQDFEEFAKELDKIMRNMDQRQRHNRRF